MSCAFTLAFPFAVFLRLDLRSPVLRFGFVSVVQVGSDASAAKSAVEADRPDVTVYLVSVTSVVTADYRTDRVRIFFDAEGKVASVPMIG